MSRYQEDQFRRPPNGETPPDAKYVAAFLVIALVVAFLVQNC